MEFCHPHTSMEWNEMYGILSPSWLQFPPPAPFSRNAHHDFAPPACILPPGESGWYVGVYVIGDKHLFILLGVIIVLLNHLI